MRILALIRLKSAVDYHRIKLPLRYMGMEDGDQVMFVSNNQQLQHGMFRGIDIVFFSRDCAFDLDTILELRTVYGFKIVVDIDDFWYLYPQHYLINNWIKNNTSQRIRQAITQADAVITTHEKLADRIEPLNPNVHVAKNALPFGHEQFNSFEVTRSPSIIYVAGLSHLNDLRSILPALHLCKNDSSLEDTEFLLAGSSGDGMVGVKLKAAAAAYGRYAMIPPLPVNMYMELYNQGTVSIAPLQNNEFNTYKSELKVLEAGCKKLPIVCTAIHPYTKLDGVEGVFLCKGPNDWYKTLRTLLLNPMKAEVAGEALHDYVKANYNLLKIGKLRRLIFKSLL